MWGEYMAAHSWHAVSMAVLLLFSAFFSGSETALFSLSRGQLAKLASHGRAGKICCRLMKHPHHLLNTLLLGNLIVNVSYTALVAVLVLDLTHSGLGAWVTPVISLGGLILLILVGEVTPKMVAMALWKEWALIASPVLAFLQRILSPLLWLLQNAAVGPLTRLLTGGPVEPSDISAEELAAVLELTTKRGAIHRDAHAMLKEIVELTDLKVSDIMVPRIDMVGVEVSGTREELHGLFKKTGLKKIPVYEGDFDHILGVIHAKHLLLSTDTPLAELVSPVTFVPEKANVERLLVHLRVHRSQLAIVVDEYGGTAGLVTLEDCLAEIVGEMPDPRAVGRGPAVQRVGADEYLLDGNLPIHEWVDAFHMDLHHERISTIGGFVTSLLGRIPKIDDQVEYRNLRFVVASMRGRRIGQLRLQLKGEMA